jgi:hypothetical protein
VHRVEHRHEHHVADGCASKTQRHHGRGLGGRLDRLVLATPLAQSLLSSHGWNVPMLSFVVLAIAMLPAAWSAGAADKITLNHEGAAQSVGAAPREAAANRGYVVMAIAFFACGLQLAFLPTHLPTYLETCGMDPALGAKALATIGVFNVGGSICSGGSGVVIPNARCSAAFTCFANFFMIGYFVVPPSPTSTLLFAAAMGHAMAWRGPLVNGPVVHWFGLRYMATLSGVALIESPVGVVCWRIRRSSHLRRHGLVRLGLERRGGGWYRRRHHADEDERAPFAKGPDRAEERCGSRPPRRELCRCLQKLTGSSEFAVTNILIVRRRPV